MDNAPLEAAAAVLERHEASLLSTPGVFGVGIGSAADHGGPDVPCIVVLTAAPLPPGAVPDQIEGVPVCVVRSNPPEQQRL